MSSTGSNRGRRISLAPSPPAQSQGLSSSGGEGARTRSAPFRAYGRRVVRIQTLVTHVQAGWQHRSAVENLGLGGARIRVEDPLDVGDVVTLSFTAPTLWDPLVLRGRVVWVGAGSPRAAGIAFEHKATDAVFALYELIVTLGYE